MSDALSIALALGYALLVGSIPTAYLVARLRRGIDIRRYGSGNVGASNVGRHVGRWAFPTVMAVDSLVKGTATVALARVLGLDLGYQAAAALVALAGHNWSVYLRFTGGRGISVLTGGLLLLAWRELAVALGVFFLGSLVVRSAGLWSGIAVVLLPVWSLLFKEPQEVVLYCAGAVVVTAAKRLLSNPGTAPPGLRWRDMALPRLLYDRDTPKAGNWVRREPQETDTGSEQ